MSNLYTPSFEGEPQIFVTNVTKTDGSILTVEARTQIEALKIAEQYLLTQVQTLTAPTPELVTAQAEIPVEPTPVVVTPEPIIEPTPVVESTPVVDQTPVDHTFTPVDYSAPTTDQTPVTDNTLPTLN